MNKEELYNIKDGDTGQQMADGLKKNFEGIIDDSVQEAPKDGKNYVRNNGKWSELPSGEGGTIVVDSELSSESTNPVQNRVVTEKLTELDNKSSYKSVSKAMSTGGSGAAYISEVLTKDWGSNILLTITKWNISNKDIRFSYHVNGSKEQKIKIFSVDGTGNYIVNFDEIPTDIRPYVLASEIETEGEVNITLYDRLATMQYMSSLDVVNNTDEIKALKEDVSLINATINGGEFIASSITGEDLINDSAYWGLNFNIGYKLSDTPKNIKNYSGYVTEVKAGQVIKLKSINNTNIIPWAITDSERLIVKKNDSFGTGSLESYTIDVEKNGYIYTNQNTATKETFSLVIMQASKKGLIEEISGLKTENTLLTNRVSKNEQDIAELKKSQGGSSTVRIGYMNLQNEEITEGKKVELEYNNIRKNYSICGYINITKFEKVRFGKDTSEQGFIIEVDNTNVKLTRSRNGTDETLYPHGLTISTFLGFDIRNVGGYSQLFLYSDSGRYKFEKEIRNPGYDSAFFESVGTTGTLLSFSQVNIDYNKDIWLIQDSYGGWVNWGWAYNLYKIGYDTFLLDSHGGAGSLSQLTVLKTHLKYATPKYLVWAMGMNDNDSVDTYNENWKLALDEVIQICNEKGIELVLCTIPNAVKEGFINTYKNRYVRTLVEEQGYKLIDFADAVQLSFESTEWKPGLLSDDELHPNEKGGQVLSIRAATDFPQLLNGKTISSIPSFVE